MLSVFQRLCLTSIASLRKGGQRGLQEERNSMEIGNWHPVRKNNLEKLCKCEGVNAKGLVTEKLDLYIDLSNRQYIKLQSSSTKYCLM